MSGTGDRLLRLIPAMVPGIALATAGAWLLPINVLVLVVLGLTTWTCASLPIGVLVGHCVLNEK